MALTIGGIACNNSRNPKTKTENKMEQKEPNVALPTADKWVKSPLRNSVKLELNAPIAEVWELVGNPSNMPTFSSGLNKVDTKSDGSGKYTEYTCHFKPTEAG